MNIQTKLLRLNRQLNQLAQISELSSARYDVLRLIKQHNPCTLGQLSEIQQVSKPTMSKLVDELQNESLIIRALSKDDARQRWIVPTQKGLQTLTKITDANQRLWDLKLAHLTERQKRSLIESIDILVKALA